MIKFNLKELLEKHDKTRYWLSKETGIDKNALTKIYNNESKQIEIETINKILNALGEELTELITYERD